MEYEFVVDASAADWSALPREFKRGERVQHHSDAYGLRGDDRRFFERETVMMSEDGKHGFTCPEEFVKLVPS